MFHRSISALFLMVLAFGCDGTRDRATGAPRPSTGGDAGVRADAGNPPRTGTHSARCNASCIAPSSGPCATADLSTCRDDCVVVTEGHEALCAQCILDHSAFAGDRCTCYGAGCNLCGFGPEASGCASPSPTDTCEASEESCEGFELAGSTDYCRVVCYGENSDGPPATTHEARCELACRRPATGPCANADFASCKQTCMARIQGLPLRCAQCVMDTMTWAGEACTCYGSGCNSCGFGYHTAGCISPGPDDTCSPAEESCDGLDMAAATDSACVDLCF